MTAEDGEHLGDFEVLIVSAPAPQTRVLLESAAPQLAARAAEVEYTPTWALMLSLDSAPRIPYDALFFEDGPLIWAANDGSKPGRRGQTWVLQAAPAWSKIQLQNTADEVTKQLTACFCSVCGVNPTAIRFQSAHRWLYSQVYQPLNIGALWDSDLNLGVCGDWCQSASIEGAFLSGIAVAGKVQKHLAGDD